MIIKLQENLSQKEIEVLIKYPQYNRTVRRLESLVKSADQSVRCRAENQEIWINASSIYYIESVDKRTFVYCENTVYRSELRLYQLIDELSDAGFIQVSKSSLININLLDSIRPLVNSRMEATFFNGEKINITRKYISAIKEKLKER